MSTISDQLETRRVPTATSAFEAYLFSWRSRKVWGSDWFDTWIAPLSQIELRIDAEGHSDPLR